MKTYLGSIVLKEFCAAKLCSESDFFHIDVLKASLYNW